jgi:hypothetical protein
MWCSWSSGLASTSSCAESEPGCQALGTDVRLPDRHEHGLRQERDAERGRKVRRGAAGGADDGGGIPATGGIAPGHPARDRLGADRVQALGRDALGAARAPVDLLADGVGERVDRLDEALHEWGAATRHGAGGLNAPTAQRPRGRTEHRGGRVEARDRARGGARPACAPAGRDADESANDGGELGRRAERQGVGGRGQREQLTARQRAHQLLGPRLRRDPVASAAHHQHGHRDAAQLRLKIVRERETEGGERARRSAVGEVAGDDAVEERRLAERGAQPADRVPEVARGGRRSGLEGSRGRSRPGAGRAPPPRSGSRTSWRRAPVGRCRPRRSSPAARRPAPERRASPPGAR